MAKKPRRKKGDPSLVDMDLVDDGSGDEGTCPIPDDDGWVYLKKRQPEPRAKPQPEPGKPRRKR